MSTKQMPENLPVTDQRKVGYGYNAITSPYANPHAVKLTNPIVNIRDVDVKSTNVPTLEARSASGSTLLELSSNLSTSLEVGAKYGLYSGSVETGFSYGKESSEEYAYVKVLTICTKRLEYLQKGTYEDKYDPTFLKALEGPACLPPEKLFEKYGTHLLLSLYLGGRLELNFSMKKSALETTSQLKVNVEAAYGEFKTKSKNEYSERTKNVVENSEIVVSAIGGTAQDFTSMDKFNEKYTAWLHSLGGSSGDESCEFCFLKDLEESFMPLWEICTDEKRAQLLEKTFYEMVEQHKAKLKGLDNYLVDYTFVSDKSASAAKRNCPPGYVLVDKDLNKDARGNFIYLCCKFGKPEQAYTNFLAERFNTGQGPVAHKLTDPHNGITAEYSRHKQDTNQGAGGKYVYLSGTKDTHYAPIRRLAVVYNTEQPGNDWYPVPWSDQAAAADFNHGAGGAYVYILQYR